MELFDVCCLPPASESRSLQHHTKLGSRLAAFIAIHSKPILPTSPTLCFGLCVLTHVFVTCKSVHFQKAQHHEQLSFQQQNKHQTQHSQSCWLASAAFKFYSTSYLLTLTDTQAITFDVLHRESPLNQPPCPHGSYPRSSFHHCQG